MTEATAESIEFEGATIDAAALAEQLYACSRLPPDPMAPSSSNRGHTKAGQLATAVRGGALEPALRVEIASLLTGDLLSIWLAATLCRVGDVVPTAVADAYKRVEAHVAGLDWVDPASTNLRDCVRGLWARHVGAGLLPWQSSHRSLLVEDWAGPLLGAALVWDHAHTVAILDALLGDSDAAVARFGLAVRGSLRRAEAEALRMELERKQLTAPTAMRQRCVDALQWYLEHDTLPDDGPMRWRRA